MKRENLYNIKKCNEELSYSGQEIIDVLTKIEYILTSLHKQGSYYGNLMHENPGNKEIYNEYCKETVAFIDNHEVTGLLAEIRRKLSEKIDSALGGDDMDDIERACQNIVYWSPDNK